MPTQNRRVGKRLLTEVALPEFEVLDDVSGELLAGLRVTGPALLAVAAPQRRRAVGLQPVPHKRLAVPNAPLARRTLAAHLGQHLVRVLHVRLQVGGAWQVLEARRTNMAA